MTKGWGLSRNVYVLAVVSLLNDIASESIYPVIPLFLGTTLGAGASVIGLIEGIAEMTASLTKGWSGALSDKLGKRRPFVLAGYGAAALAKGLLALATGWGFVLACRVLDRLGKGVRSTARDAMIAESVGYDKRGLAFGLHRSTDQLGGVIGPLLSIPVLLWLSNDYRALFLVATIPATLSIFVLFAAKETGVAPRAPRPVISFAAWREAPPAFQRYLLIWMLFALGNSSDVFLLMRAKQMGFAPAEVVQLFALFNAVSVVTGIPSGVLSDRIGRRTVLVCGLVVFAIVYLGFGVAQPGSLWALFALYGVYSGAALSAARAYVVDLTPPSFRATALGLHGMAGGIMTLCASLLAGAMWDRLGPATPFLFGGVTALVTAFLLLTAPRYADTRASA